MFGYIIQYRTTENGESVLHNYCLYGALQVFVSEIDANNCAIQTLGLKEFEVVKVDVNFA